MNQGKSTTKKATQKPAKSATASGKAVKDSRTRSEGR